MSFRHEGHIGSDGVAAKFSFDQSTAGLSAREVEYLKREASTRAGRRASPGRRPPLRGLPRGRNPCRRPRSTSRSTDSPACRSARRAPTRWAARRASESWAKRAAARVAGKMLAKRIQDEIRKNEALLLQAQAELRAAESGGDALSRATRR